MIWAHWFGYDSIISTNLLKMSIISKNVFIPGFSTLIVNMIVSFSSENQSSSEFSPWILEYVHGMDHELYFVTFY